MGSLRIVLVLVALLGLAACGGGLGPDLDFDVPDFDVPDVDPGPQLRQKPSVNVADGGKATCAWVGDGHVYAERFIPALGWSDYTRIDNGNPTADAPQTTTTPDGDAMVVWTQDGEVVANCFEVGSGWQGPVVVSSPGGAPGRNPRVGTADDGEVVVIYEEDGNVVSRCFVPGAGWLAPDPVATPIEPASEPEVAVNASGDAVAVWTEGTNDVVASTFESDTGMWSEPVPVGTGTNPEVAIDDQGAAAVVFVDGDDAEVTMLDPTNGWTAPVVVPMPTSHAADPVRMPAVDIAPTTGDTIVVVEVDGEILASRQPMGGSFEEAVPAMPGVNASGRPRVTMDDEGNAMTVVEDGAGHVHSAIYREAYDRWTPPTDEGTGREPVVDANASGETIAVYVVGSAIGATRVNDLDPTVPRTLNVVIQGQGRVMSDNGLLDCTSSCSLLVPDGTEGLLIAEPAAGFVFSHWVEASSTEQTLPTQISGGDATVTAVFVAIP